MSREVCDEGIDKDFVKGETVYAGEPTKYDCGIVVVKVCCGNCSKASLFLDETLDTLVEAGTLPQKLEEDMFCKRAVETVVDNLRVDARAVLSGADSVVQ